MGSSKNERLDPGYQRAVTTIAWFVQLAHAEWQHKFAAAAEAEQELARLGVIVKYRRRAARQPR